MAERTDGWESRARELARGLMTSSAELAVCLEAACAGTARFGPKIEIAVARAPTAKRIRPARAASPAKPATAKKRGRPARKAAVAEA